MADFDVTIGADLGDLLKELKGVSDLTDKEFRQATKGIERSFKRSTREARKLRDAMRKDVTKEGKAAFEAVKQLGEGVGGSLGGAVGAVEKFGRAIVEAGSALGPMGIAVGAVAAGVVGYSFAAVKATQAIITATETTRQWRDELVEAGLASSSSGENLDAFGQQIEAARMAVKAAAVAIGDEFARVLTEHQDLAFAAAGAIKVLAEDGAALAAETFRLANVVAELTIDFADLLGEVTGVGDMFPRVTAAARDLRGAVEENTLAVDLNKRGLSDMLGVQEAVNNLRRQAKFEAREQAAASKAAADAEREAASAAREEAAALREAEQARQRVISTWLKQQQMIENFIRGVKDLADAERDAADEAENFEEAYERALQESKVKAREVAASIAASFAGAFADVVGSMEGLVAANSAKIQDQLNEIEESISDNEAALEEARAAGDEARVAELEAEKVALEQTEKERQDALVRSFYAQQDMAITQAIINGAVAATMAATSAPPPFNIPIIAASAAATALEIATIKAQQPPTFPTGGMVGDQVSGDHVLVGAQSNEAVLNKGAVDALGGRAAIDALNQQRMGPQTVQANFYINDKLVHATLQTKAGQRVIRDVVRSVLREQRVI